MGTQNTLLTEEMRQKAIGMEGEPSTIDIEMGHIQSFAAAVGDPNPLWNDEAQARKSRYGGVVAPPTFLRAIRVERPQPPLDQPLDRLLDGGSEWEYFEPIRVGDRITAIARIVDVSERSGRMGTMIFVANEVRYANQFDELVATQRNTLIWY